MRRLALIVGVLAGLALAFALCGGAGLVGKVRAAMDTQPVSVASLSR